MGQKLEQIASVVTPVDAAHGGLGIIAVLNGLWLSYLNPIVQILVAVGGLVYLYFLIRSKRMEWRLKQLEYKQKLKEAG